MPPFGGVDFSAFLDQPLDVIVNQLIWLFGWVPIVIALAMGLMLTWVEIQRKHWRSKRPYILLAIDVPRLTEQSPKAVENIFAITVALKSSPVWLETYLQGKNQWRHSFEITSINGYIQFYIWTEERYRDAYEAAVYAQYPDAEIALVEDYTKAVPHHYPDEQYDLWGSEYVLDREYFFPIRTWEDFEHSASRDEYLKDPLTNLFEGMAMMRPGEQMWFQVVTDYADEGWKKEGDAFINKTFGADLGAKKESFVGSGLNMLASIPGTIVGDILGAESNGVEDKKDVSEIYKAFKVTEQEREITKAVVRKIAKPGLRCKIRIIYVARKEVFSKVTRKDMVKGTLKQLQHGDLNRFSGFGSPEDDYFWQVWWYSYNQNRLIEGYVGRSMEIGGKPFVLNTEELATIWHFPSVFVKAPLIKKTLAKRAEPPTETPFASEAEEMLTAPSMHLPEGSVSEKVAHEVDIFTAPMSMPPIASELPEEWIEPDEAGEPRGERVGRLDESSDRPIVTSPTASLGKRSTLNHEVQTTRAGQTGSVGQLPPKFGTAGSPNLTATADNFGGSLKKAARAPSASATLGASHQETIPDAIRVLIQPGVEPEDVGIRDTIEDDL